MIGPDGIVNSWYFGLPISITQSNEPELSGRINDQIFCHPADMRHSETGPHHRLNDEITVAHAPQTVLSNGLKSKFIGEEITGDDEWVSGERATSKGEDGYAGHKLSEALEIRKEGECMGEKEVRPTNWLTTLL